MKKESSKYSPNYQRSFITMVVSLRRTDILSYSLGHDNHVVLIYAIQIKEWLRSY